MSTRAVATGNEGNAERLHRYWTAGKGLARWRDTPHPWTALYHHLLEHMHEDEAKRTAATWYHEVFGHWPGAHHKGAGTMDTVHVYAGDVLKWDDTPEGLMVHGIATSPAKDLDHQVCDPEWLKSAMPEWYKWGNIREQHSTIAAGVGRELEAGADNRWGLKSLVVDDGTQRKVKAGVLKGYSIGIQGAQVMRGRPADPPGGTIVGGQIVEISLVDRPCNPEAMLSLAKAHGGQMLPVDQAGDVVVKMGEPVTEPPAGDEPDGTSHGHPGDEVVPPVVDQVAAEPDAPSVQTERETALAPEDTDKTLSLADYRAAVKLVRSITKGVNNETSDIAGAQSAIALISRLIISEATELGNGRMEEAYDISLLLDAVSSLRQFLSREQQQDGQTNDTPDSMDVFLTAESEVTKAAPPVAEAGTVSDVTETVTKAVAEANRASQERITALEATLAKVLATPVPGGPVIMHQGSAQDAAKASRKGYYLDQAAKATDQGIADSYRALAAQEA